MGRVALLFAGQGAQHPGMGLELAEREPAARAVFDLADAVRPGTTDQIARATRAELAETLTTQPCVLACDLACARALAAHGVRAAAVAGFSLGELAALAFAGALTDEEALRLVCRRAQLMSDAATAHPGGMRAVVKLDADQVNDLAAQAGAWPVNYNSPQQTAVAGTPEALERLDTLVREAGGRALKMAVSGAFHSPCMADAAQGLAETLSAGDLPRAPRIPVIANSTAAPYPADADAHAERAALLAHQVERPVRWVDTLQALAQMGIDTFIEVGPGNTLTGLVKRTLPQARALACETPRDLDTVLAELGITAPACTQTQEVAHGSN